MTRYELDKFIQLCNDGDFIDYDGWGYYSNSRDTHTKIVVYPSDIKAGKINRSYKYVHWYNR